jgi:hypothetical protein
MRSLAWRFRLMRSGSSEAFDGEQINSIRRRHQQSEPSGAESEANCVNNGYTSALYRCAA